MPPHSHSIRPERGLLRWAAALAITLALHGGAVAAGLMQWRDAPPPAMPAAAIMLELAPVPVAPANPVPANPTSATPEWRRPDPLPTPRAVPEPAAAAAADSTPPPPKLTPSDPLPIAAAPKPVVEPPKEKPKKAETQKLAATEKPAAKREPAAKEKPAKREKPAAKPIPAAPQSQPAPQAVPVPAPAAAPAAPAAPVQQAAIAAAPSATELVRRAAAQANWQGLLLAHLERHKNYPRAARKRQEQGTSLLRFRMDRSGRVLSYALAKSSGYEALDAEVLAMIERAQPLPPLPAEIPEAVVQIVVPVQFALR